MNTSTSIVLVSTLFTIALVPCTVLAQTADTTPHTVCWFNTNTTKCRNTVVMEMGVQTPLASTSVTREYMQSPGPNGPAYREQQNFQNTSITLGVSLLHNIDRIYAVGPSFDYSNGLTRVGARVRRTQPGGLVTEGRVGIVRGNALDSWVGGVNKTTGLSAEVRVGEPRYLMMGLSYDDMPLGDVTQYPYRRIIATSSRARSLSATATLGPVPSLVSAGVLTVLLAIAISTFSGD